MSDPSMNIQEYWLPGYGLSRYVVLRNIQYFLGPSSRVRPYTYQGREGYLIHGPCLTRDQIEDLQTLSKEYELEAAMRMTSRQKSNDSEVSEPYINELVPVGPTRRSSPDYIHRRGR